MKPPWDLGAFNKNLHVSFERSSLDSAYGYSYDPIGQKRSGDGAATRTPLATARRTVDGCSPAGQWGARERLYIPNSVRTYVTRRRERFFKRNKILVAHVPPNRSAVAGRACRRDPRATRRPRGACGYLSLGPSLYPPPAQTFP